MSVRKPDPRVESQYLHGNIVRCACGRVTLHSIHNGICDECFISNPPPRLRKPKKEARVSKTEKDNYGQPKSEYFDKITGMDDAALEVEAEQMIWLSAFAHNNPRSDYHWQSDAIYKECSKRDKPEIYQRAFDKAIAGFR